MSDVYTREHDHYESPVPLGVTATFCIGTFDVRREITHPLSEHMTLDILHFALGYLMPPILIQS